MARSLAVIVSLALVAPGCGAAEASTSPVFFSFAGGEDLPVGADPLGPVAPATLSPVGDERGVAAPLVLDDGSVLVVDNARSRVLRVTPTGQRIVVAGTGRRGFGGDGGPAVRAALDGPTALAAYRGGFLISDEWNFRVRWVGPDGVISTVAGNGQDIGPGPGGGPTGDGGPALQARISRPEALAVLPDGGFVVSDAGSVVRSVDANGIVTRLAGTGTAGDSGDGGPAIAADINVFSLAATPDGGVLIGSGHSVRRVAPGGTITTVAGGFGGVFGLLALPDGGYLVADGYRHAVRRVGSDGSVSTLYGPDAFRDFAGRGFYTGLDDGYSAAPSGLAASPEGLLVTTSHGVLLARGPTSSRPAVRIVATRVSAARLAVTVDTPTDATATVDVFGPRRRVARSVAVPVAAGRRRLELATQLEPGAYTARVVVDTATGTAADRVKLALGATLDRDLVEGILYDALNSDVLHLGRCARISGRRVDCAVMASRRRCVYAIAVTRHRDGLLWRRTYRCAKGRPFRAHPAYRTAARLLPSSDYY
jgi:hypothetical protein